MLKSQLRGVSSAKVGPTATAKKLMLVVSHNLAVNSTERRMHDGSTFKDVEESWCTILEGGAFGLSCSAFRMLEMPWMSFTA
jgi:hypothetical protein